MLKEKVIGLELKVRIIGHCQVQVIEYAIRNKNFFEKEYFKTMQF